MTKELVLRSLVSKVKEQTPKDDSKYQAVIKAFRSNREMFKDENSYGILKETFREILLKRVIKTRNSQLVDDLAAYFLASSHIRFRLSSYLTYAVKTNHASVVESLCNSIVENSIKLYNEKSSLAYINYVHEWLLFLTCSSMPTERKKTIFKIADAFSDLNLDFESLGLGSHAKFIGDILNYSLELRDYSLIEFLAVDMNLGQVEGQCYPKKNKMLPIEYAAINHDEKLARILSSKFISNGNISRDLRMVILKYPMLQTIFQIYPSASSQVDKVNAGIAL